MALNFYDTPGFDIYDQETELSKYKERDFHVIVIDLSK
jgi:hypothetical protein